MCPTRGALLLPAEGGLTRRLVLDQSSNRDVACPASTYPRARPPRCRLRHIREQMFVSGYVCTPAEDDPERPWIVARQEHRTVTLDAGLNFVERAHERWPARRWTVKLDPWQLAGRLGRE